MNKFLEKAKKISEQIIGYWEMGIDEAGRGPVLGSLVYGSISWPITLKNLIGNIGFTDSKKLNKIQRENLYQSIQYLRQHKYVQFNFVQITAQQLSSQMLSKSGKNLNQISHQAIIQLINLAINSNKNITHIYIDTVGVPKDLQHKLNTHFDGYGLNFTVATKADLTFKVVGAASIIAKVNRDKILQNWTFKQDIDINKNYGSGYPADPITKQWLKQYVDPVFSFPSLVRFSWQTCKTIERDYVAKRQQVQIIDLQNQKLNLYEQLYMIRKNGKL